MKTATYIVNFSMIESAPFAAEVLQYHISEGGRVMTVSVDDESEEHARRWFSMNGMDMDRCMPAGISEFTDSIDVGRCTLDMGHRVTTDWIEVARKSGYQDLVETLQELEAFSGFGVEERYEWVEAEYSMMEWNRENLETLGGAAW